MKLVVGKDKRIALLCACVAWVFAVGIGLSLVWSYESTAGLGGQPLDTWDASSRIERHPGEPTLVMIVHPQCPCSRASINELRLVMARTQGLVNAVVVFIKPAAFPDAWVQTDLWESAARIPGVSVMRDDEGVEARRFGSHTSGQTMLYAADGQLLFSGGITEGRGHSGENDGRNAIVSLLTTGSSGKTATSVYGCPLFNKPTNDQTPDNSCHAVSSN